MLSRCLLQWFVHRVGDDGQHVANGGALTGLHHNTADIAATKRFDLRRGLVSLDDKNLLAFLDQIAFLHEPFGHDDVVAGCAHAGDDNLRIICYPSAFPALPISCIHSSTVFRIAKRPVVNTSSGRPEPMIS